MLTKDTSIERGVFRALFFLKMITAGVFLLYSCSKKIEDGAIGGSAILAVTVGDIITEDVTGPKGKAKRMSIPQQTLRGEPINNRRVLTNGNLYMSFTAAEGQPASLGEGITPSTFTKVKQPSLYKQMSTSPTTALAAAKDIAMANGVKYRFMLYNKSTQRFESSVQAISGTKLEVEIVKGQEYDWYAYSYNNEEDIPSPNVNNPKIPTYTDRPLLYQKGSVKIGYTGNATVKITFRHQIKQLKIHIDSRGLFGDIISHAAEFMADDYVKTGLFNIMDSTLSNLTTVPTTTLNMVQEIQGSSRLLVDSYYTSDITRDSYQVKVTDLSVKLPNNTVQDLIQDFPGGREETFEFSDGGKGKVHYAQIDIWRKITSKTVVHFETNPPYSYTASQTDLSSGAFFFSRTNFGPDVSSHMRVDALRHETITFPKSDDIYKRLEGKDATDKDPSILIISNQSVGYSTDDYDALIRYLERGGAVLLLMGPNSSQTLQNQFFKKIFPGSQSLFTEESDRSGTVYKLNDVDPNILTWPFGDVRNRYWGSHGTKTVYLKNLSANDLANIVVYCNGSVNLRDNHPDGISIFRHKTLNLFYVGEVGFLANRYPDFTSPDASTDNPFTVDANYYPIPKPRYGRGPEPGSLEAHKSSASWTIQNSILFGNIISWLIMQSQFQGVADTP